VLEQAATLADAITQLIKGRSEPVGLMSLYNKLLDSRQTEIIEALASENQEKRGLLIGSLFTQLIEITQKESYIQKHLVSLFYAVITTRLVSKTHHFVLQTHHSALLHSLDERHQHVRRR